jgi:hypothetical protein
MREKRAEERPSVLVPELRPGDLVVMDNLGNHKGGASAR